MHRWYVKARYQEDHDERSVALGCDYVLEDTSAQVDPTDSLPHVIIQVGRAGDDGSYNFPSLVFPEPVLRSTLDAVPGDETPPGGEVERL